MHLRVRSSEQFPSGLELLTVRTDDTEVHNTAAQELWEGAPLSEQSVYLKVLSHRPIVPILVVQFIEFGYTCLLQESNGVAQWCLELAEDGTCPDDLINGLRRHPLLSDHLFEIIGDRYSQMLALTRILRGTVPVSISEATHRVEINLRKIKGVLSYTTGYTPLITSPDAHLADLFLMICGVESPRMFTLRYRDGLRRHEYEDVAHSSARVWGGPPLGRAISMMAEPHQQ